MDAIFDTDNFMQKQYNQINGELWDMYIGDASERTGKYRKWLCDLLRTHDCTRILDAATGTGIDSAILFDEGFEVTSIDYSSQMLENAIKLRSRKAENPRVTGWAIHQANWLTLEDDLTNAGALDELFDAVVLLGNSFTHLPNDDQKFTLQKIAMQNFRKILKPGGLLVLDHRNYDVAMTGGSGVAKSNSFYSGKRLEKIDTYMIVKNGKFSLIALDIFINVANGIDEHSKKIVNFKLFGYPITLDAMTCLIEENFKPSKHVLYADFEEFDPKENDKQPNFYCHVAQKKP